MLERFEQESEVFTSIISQHAYSLKKATVRPRFIQLDIIMMETSDKLEERFNERWSITVLRTDHSCWFLGEYTAVQCNCEPTMASGDMQKQRPETMKDQK